MTTTSMLMESGNLINSIPYRLSGRSGSMTIIAADADVFALRNISVKPVAISQIRSRFVTTTSFGAAQGLAFQFNKVTGFSAIHSGGSGIALSARRRKTSCGPAIATTEIIGQICDAAAITTATYVIDDADEPFESLVGGGAVSFSMASRYTPTDGFPEVLEANEGIICRVVNTMGATGVGHLFISVDFFRY